MQTQNYVILGSASYGYLAKKVAECGHWPLGSVFRDTFEGGDPYMQVNIDDVQGKDVVIVGGTITPAEFYDILRLGHTVWNFGAESITFVIPYFGTQRQERVTKPGEHLPAKLDALLFSALPRPPRGIRVFMVDLHLEQITSYFENGVRAWPIQCKSLIATAVSDLGKLYGGDYELLGCDQGVLKWVQSIGDVLKKNAGCGLKRRIDGKSHMYGIMGEVDGRHIVAFDDIQLTGGTAMKLMELAKTKGALGGSLVVSHCVSPDDSFRKVAGSRLFDRVITTDSHPHALEIEKEFGSSIEVRSISPLIAERLVTPWWATDKHH